MKTKRQYALLQVMRCILLGVGLLMPIKMFGQPMEYLIAQPKENKYGIDQSKRTIYNAEAINSLKFKKEKLYDGDFYGIPLQFEELIDNKKYLLQVFTINNQRVGYYIPKKSKKVDRDAPYRYHAEWSYNIYTNSEPDYIYKGPGWKAYSVDSINMVKELLRTDSILVYVGPTIGDNSMRSRMIYGDECKLSDFILNSSLIYKYQTIREPVNHGDLRIIQSKEDILFQREYDEEFGFSDVLNRFKPRAQVVEECKNKYNQDSIALFVDSLIGTRIYLDHSYYVYPEVDGNKFKEVKRGFYTVSGIDFLYNSTSSAYIMKLEDEDHKQYSFRLPYNCQVEYIPASVKLAQIEEEQRQEAEYERKQNALIDAENKAYIKELAKKYGPKNAAIIADGAVRIGFTKQMCEEAWGAPYTTSHITTEYGSSEVWYYIGSTLFFRGNKLVVIQD